MIPTRIALDPDLYDHASEVARRRGVSLAELCRQALREAVARHPEAAPGSSGDRPWMAYLGTLSGRPRDSCRVDEVVYGRVAR
ncbi:MAG: ribbon-helix-helix domain-containing protein [Gemmatimonadota bacterium]|nr:ribbon-helix-helix domain-containing protein [Gemmatimonadota bacterium]MDE2871714.1 ribbon-helix-helix domain-containing protein [Gemmatimonadota bacterium]